MTAGELKNVLKNVDDNATVAAMNVDYTISDRNTVVDAYNAKGICDDEFIDVFIIGFE